MNRLTTKFDATTGESNVTSLPAGQSFIDSFATVLIQWMLKEDLDDHLIRTSMVAIFLFFGMQ